ncbi:MAG: hypothetical protein IKD07_02690 [Clostridia bacterium]|nr:hypothetical protein [Clostridia bacterium]
MEFTTIANGLKLEHSDTVIVYDKQPVSVCLNGGFTITFVFVDDGTEANLAYNIVDGGLQITLINFNHALGTSSAQPFEFGAINGKPLYIAFSVRAVMDVKILQYNIYIKA